MSIKQKVHPFTFQLYFIRIRNGHLMSKIACFNITEASRVSILKTRQTIDVLFLKCFLTPTGALGIKMYVCISISVCVKFV